MWQSSESSWHHNAQSLRLEKKYGPDSAKLQVLAAEHDEIRQLKKELKRVAEERDILKKPLRTLPASPSKVRLY